MREKEKEIRRGARQQGDAGRGGEFEEEVKEVKAKLLMKEKEMRKAERAGEGKDKKIRELEVGYLGWIEDDGQAKGRVWIYCRPNSSL